jgi:hypothetical protein
MELHDKGYDSDDIRDDLAERGIEPVIPPRSNRKTPIEYDREATLNGAESGSPVGFFAAIRLHPLSTSLHLRSESSRSSQNVRVHERSGFARHRRCAPYTRRFRRLSSMTCMPSLRVIGAPGHRLQAAR